MRFFSNFSGGIPSFSYIEMKNPGISKNIMIITAGWVPPKLCTIKKIGAATAIVMPYVTACRFVNFSRERLFICFISLGTVTYAIVFLTENLFLGVFDFGSARAIFSVCLLFD